MVCRRIALKRALVNVIDNAVKYGSGARVGIENRPDVAEIIIDDCANVATSFPDFVALAQRIGMSVEVEGANDR